MVEVSQSLSDMPARRAAASALSRTNGSMPSTLHDTREFMLSSGSDSGAPPAPSASPRVPEKRQSNSARVVCLWQRLFRVTVNNRLRSWLAGTESWLRCKICLKGARASQLGEHHADLQSPSGRRQLSAQRCVSDRPLRQ